MNALPLTVRRSIELAGIVILAMVIIEWRQIIMPMLMALIASIVLLPAYRRLRRMRLPEVVSIILPILMMLTIICLILWFVSAQVKPMIDNFSQIRQNITNHIQALSNWFSEKTSISTTDQAAFVNKQTKSFVDSAGNFITGAAGSVGAVLIFFGLLPIYTFLILYYKGILSKFVYYWFAKADHENVQQVIHKTEMILKSYIAGLLIQITYITVLLGGSLLLFGIKHAMLIGIIFAILNLIPYIGALFGNLIGVLLTLSSSPEIGPVITVLLAIAVVQFLDNNILMPGIVGSKIRINALASLAGVFAGGALAGIPGMFLSLPLIAILKIIFDHTEQFKQWGILFGDERPVTKISRKIFKPSQKPA